MHTLGNCSIPVADKQELSLSSPFAGIDKTSLLNAGQTGVPVPSVTSRKLFLPATVSVAAAHPYACNRAESEIAEITSLLCRKREAEPAKWRRFVVVVDREDPTVADLAKQRGVRKSLPRKSSYPELIEHLVLRTARSNCVPGLV